VPCLQFRWRKVWAFGTVGPGIVELSVAAPYQDGEEVEKTDEDEGVPDVEVVVPDVRPWVADFWSCFLPRHGSEDDGDEVERNGEDEGGCSLDLLYILARFVH
jgi:hypothetical protein